MSDQLDELIERNERGRVSAVETLDQVEERRRELEDGDVELGDYRGRA